MIYDQSIERSIAVARVGRIPTGTVSLSIMMILLQSISISSIGLLLQINTLTAFTSPVQRLPVQVVPSLSLHVVVSVPPTSLYAARITNIESVSVSEAGSDPDSPGKVNQDVAFHHGLVGERFLFGGVLDGHGKKGHVLNEFLGSYIPKSLEDYLGQILDEDEDVGSGDSNNDSGGIEDIDMHSKIEKVMVDTFENAHLAARMDESVPAGRSGTTCVVCIVDTRTAKIYTGNVGDSRAIIAFKRLSVDDSDAGADAGVNDDSNHDDWTVVPLSNETTTKRECERARIDKGEGRIDSGGNVWYGPVGIAMTRALGDAVMLRAGVLSTPEVTCFDLNEDIPVRMQAQGQDREYAYALDGIIHSVRICIGSDGIFDVLKNEEANTYLHGQIQSGKSLEESCNMLVEEARRKWKGGLPLDVRIDDTSVVALTFNYADSLL